MMATHKHFRAVVTTVNNPKTPDRIVAITLAGPDPSKAAPKPVWTRPVVDYGPELRTTVTPRVAAFSQPLRPCPEFDAEAMIRAVTEEQRGKPVQKYKVPLHHVSEIDARRRDQARVDRAVLAVMVGEMTTGQIAEKLGRSPAYVVQPLARLVHNNLVVRKDAKIRSQAAPIFWRAKP